jgi:exonuclease SbcC
MKILELRFKNLNSLYGEWIIDFTDPEYVSNGIFALTGPTGAGKSTILDALCLALYGATPRLGKITKSSNEIMSRQTGECYAEVLFESTTGRYRCHWEQRRARKKAEGNLQDQEHHISDALTGKPIETKKSLTGAVIEEKTGMDFDRFTRSILLAQGGFDTFLKADTEQKSKILEQITGTGIYSEISRRVHERRRDEQEKLNLLQAETSGIIILDPEQEQEIRQKLAEEQNQESELAVKSTGTGNAITWLTAIQDLEKELFSLKEQEEKLQITTRDFKTGQARLEQAQKAACLDGKYATLTTLRKEQTEDTNSLKKYNDLLPDLETSAKIQSKALQASEQKAFTAKEDLKAAEPLIRKIRSLDQKIEEQAKIISENTQSCTIEAARININKQARIKEQKNRILASKSLEKTEEYLKKNAQDEWLISNLAGIEEQFSNLLAKNREIIQKQNEFKNAGIILSEFSKKLDTAAKQYTLNMQNLKETTKNLHCAKDSLCQLLENKLLREYRSEKESLLREMAYIKKIEELKDHRARLEDNKPCPLCGSTNHPYAAGNIPVPDEIEQKIESLTKVINKAENMEEAIKKLEEDQKSVRQNLNNSEILKTNAENDKKTAETTLAQLTENLSKVKADFEELKLSVSAKLQPLGIKEVPESELAKLLQSLKAKLNSWQKQVKEKTEIEKKIAAIDGEIGRLNAVIDTQSSSMAEKQENLEHMKKEHTALTDERKKLYGAKNPDQEETLLNKALADAEKSEKTAGNLNTQFQQKLTETKTRAESLKNRICQREPELTKAESDFMTALITAGFADEKLFLQARLTSEEQKSLSSRAQTLTNAWTELKTRQKDRETRLALEQAKKLTEKTLEDLEPQFREFQELLKNLQHHIAALKHKLNENTAAQERIKEKQSAIEAQKKECFRWEKLHTLIGSSDGKKYRNFAQGLTFELMVSHANRQLEKMTDRYLLIRDDQQPLELNVVDNYQAGEIRSTKNLSGGESFIVSLTLALGLSKMASRKVRVDSLFLDEGFGTLDDESLETALETLSGLHQKGKLIGIISHVSALKERIGTQINISPVSGGRSSLAGPGIRSIFFIFLFLLYSALVPGSVKAGSKILTGVPRYDWWYGCAPTSSGMVIGYWDGLGYNLVDGDMSAVNSALGRSIIASPEHIADYWVSYGSSAPDPNPGGHAANSIADFIHTSYKADGLTDGSSSSLFYESGLEAFAVWDNPATLADEAFNNVTATLMWAGINFDFNVFKSQIDKGAPVLLSGDVDGTATPGGGHMVVGYGYNDPDGVPGSGDELTAVFDTWGPPGPSGIDSAYSIMSGGHEWWPFQTSSVNDWYIAAGTTFYDPVWLDAKTVPEADTIILFCALFFMIILKYPDPDKII